MRRDTSFREAKESFQSFLSGQGLSPDLVWLFREDVICRPGLFLIRVPLPPENERLAEACYEVGRKRDLGICLHAFCLADSRPCCYVQLPGDDVEAQYMLMGNLSLKCSVRTRLLQAQPVRNPTVWFAKKWLARVSDTHVYVPDKLPYKKLRGVRPCMADRGFR